MKIDTMMIEISHSCDKGMFGKYALKTETAFITKWDIENYGLDLKKSLMKAIGTLKQWDDYMQIRIRENENRDFVRTWFFTREYDDRENGTVTIAQCAPDGTFELEDRKHKAVNVVKKEIGAYIDSLEFI